MCPHKAVENGRKGESLEITGRMGCAVPETFHSLADHIILYRKKYWSLALYLGLRIQIPRALRKLRGLVGRPTLQKTSSNLGYGTWSSHFCHCSVPLQVSVILAGNHRPMVEH